MIVTLHVCDNCNKKIDEKDLKEGQFFDVVLKVKSFKGSLEEPVHFKQWCRRCVDKFSLLGVKLTKDGIKPRKPKPLTEIIPRLVKPTAKATIRI